MTVATSGACDWVCVAVRVNVSDEVAVIEAVTVTLCVCDSVGDGEPLRVCVSEGIRVPEELWVGVCGPLHEGVDVMLAVTVCVALEVGEVDGGAIVTRRTTSRSLYVDRRCNCRNRRCFAVT